MIRFTTTATAIAALLGGAALAKDAADAPPDPVIAAAAAAQARDEARTAQAQARTALLQAQQAEATARFALVPKSPATGTATIDAGAGQLEATMLAGRALQTAAAGIASKVGGDCTGTLVVGADDAPQFDVWIAFQPATTELIEGFTKIAEFKPKPGPAAALAANPKLESFLVAGAAVQAAIDLLKTDIDIKPLTVTTTAGMAARAVAAKCPNAVLPGELLFPKVASTTVDEKLRAVRSARAAAFASFAGQADTPGERQRKAWFETLATRHDALTAALYAPDDAGRRPIAQLHRLALLSSRSKVLRVIVDSAGGTQFVKRNLLTVIGVDPLTVTGGTVVSYSLADMSTGVVSSSGMFVCGTGRTRLGAAHGNRAPAPVCSAI